MPSDVFNVLYEEWLCRFIQMSISNGDFEWEFQRLVSKVWWPDDSLELELFRELTVLFNTLVKVWYSSGFECETEIICEG